MVLDAMSLCLRSCLDGMLWLSGGVIDLLGIGDMLGLDDRDQN